MLFILLLAGLIIIIIVVHHSYSSRNYADSDQRSDDQGSGQRQQPVGKPLITNAPEHWGVLTDGFLESNKSFVSSYDEHVSAYAKRMFMVNGLLVMGEINKAFQEIKGEKVLSSYSDALLETTERWATSCCIDMVFDKGIFQLTGIAVDDYKRFAVMLFDTPVPQAYIDELREYFIQDGYEDLIYFSVTDPSTISTPRKLKFEQFNIRCFKYDANKQGARNRKYDSYAIWWQGELENSFMKSAIKDDTRIHLDLLDHYNSYALGILSFAFGLKKKNTRIRMPDYDEVTINGPEGVEIIITLSETRGINFHFPVRPQYERYRNNFIKAYVNFCYSIRSQIIENELSRDDFGQPSTLEWYNGLIRHVEHSGEEVAAVGLLSKTEDWNLN